MTFDSLPTFLDPNDPTKTIEGHPAPKRAVVVATKPELQPVTKYLSRINMYAYFDVRFI